MMRELLLKNIELEKEFKDINLDGVGEFVKEMMLDLQWDLFTAVQKGEAEYISVYQMSLIESSNKYATTLLENKEQLIEALSKAETEFIEDMNKRDVEINEYAIKDNSLEYLPLSIEFFEDMTN